MPHRHVALVDGAPSGRAAELTQRLAALPQKGKVHTLFNTHWHPEQTGSNESLGQAGATIVDPVNVDRTIADLIPYIEPGWLKRNFPAAFPDTAKPIDRIVSMAFDHGLVPTGVRGVNLRMLAAQPRGYEAHYMINRYLRERGDANIKTNADLIAKARFYEDPNFPDRRQARLAAEKQLVLDTAARLQGRFAMQTMLLQCMQEQRLDALMSPMSTVPPRRMTQPREPNVNGRSPVGWSFLGQQGFPVISVPAGFTTEVWDRVREGSGTRLAGPIAARLPVGVDFVGRPFDEPLLFRIAAADEARTGHRGRPPDFGPWKGEP